VSGAQQVRTFFTNDDEPIAEQCRAWLIAEDGQHQPLLARAELGLPVVDPDWFSLEEDPPAGRYRGLRVEQTVGPRRTVIRHVRTKIMGQLLGRHGTSRTTTRCLPPS